MCPLPRRKSQNEGRLFTARRARPLTPRLRPQALLAGSCGAIGTGGPLADHPSAASVARSDRAVVRSTTLREAARKDDEGSPGREGMRRYLHLGQPLRAVEAQGPSSIERPSPRPPRDPPAAFAPADLPGPRSLSAEAHRVLRRGLLMEVINLKTSGRRPRGRSTGCTIQPWG
jgi:hypothetical protein